MTVLVVGGGIAGLAAAYELERAGAEAVLVEGSRRLGGKVATERIDGFVLEEGPDSFLAARPALLELCRELGLEAELIEPCQPRVVFVLWRGRLVPLPEGLAPLTPTRLGPFLRSPLLGPLEKLRAGLDLVLPRSPDVADLALGPFVRRRLGQAVVERIAQPLLGGIYTSDVEQMSLRATFPGLWEMERRHGSLLRASLAAGRAARRRTTPAPPLFLSLTSGMDRLIERLAAALRRTEVLLGSPVRALERLPDGYRARLADGSTVEAESVVLAVGPAVAARLLEPSATAAAGALGTFEAASAAVVTLAFRRADLARLRAGHGFLVVSGEPVRIGACTWSSAKWPGRAPAGAFVLRTFVGRSGEPLLDCDDRTIVEAVRGDLERAMGISAEPLLVRIHRFPGAMPTYRVGHQARVAAVEAALALEGGRIALAGAAYRGVGLTDCVAQGRQAARKIRAVSAGGRARDALAVAG